MANTRCPAKYKNLGLETFGNKKKVTDEILKQCCKNDEWLRQNVEELRYLSSPAIRKTRKISETIDEDKSWGCMVKDNKVQFSNETTKTFTIDLTNEEGISKWFDDSQSTVVSHEEEINGVKFRRIQIFPHEETIEAPTTSFGTADMWSGYNSAWYVGFDKSKPFYLKPKWVKNWKNLDLKRPEYRVPAIARAQTFRVPEGKGGHLTSVDLQLEYNGTPTKSSSSPLYVQIWNTYKGWVNVSTWDTKKKQTIIRHETIKDHQDAHNGNDPPSNWQRYDRKKVYEKNRKGEIIKDAKGNKKFHWKWVKNKNGSWIVKRRKYSKPASRNGDAIKKPLAEYVYDTEGKTVKGGFQTMPFKTPPLLKEGESYAIVLLSPLNSWETCPRWGGWGRNCTRYGTYSAGNAFYSTDNGVSWKRYGNKGKDEGVEVYQQGLWVPQDYRFSCKIKKGEDETQITYSTDVEEMYLKPIYGNPIYRVTITPFDIKTLLSEESENQYIVYQLSTDGDNWYTFPTDTMSIKLTEPSRVVFIRALLQTTDESVTPYIEKINVKLDMNLPTEMYARTQYYTPEKFGTILGASVWGRVFAPYTLEDENIVDCKVDVIQKKENSEHFNIVDLEVIDDKIAETGLSIDWLTEHEDIESRCRYLTSHPEILKTLREDYNIYILPYELSDGLHNLSFAPSDDLLVVSPLSDEYSDVVVNEGTDEETGEKLSKYPDYIGEGDNKISTVYGIPLIHEVAYPISSCQLEPEEGGGEVVSYGEWYDYTFDYKTNKLIFKRDTLNHMNAGTLVVSYNPVFIKDLTNNEIGIHYDSETGLRSDGLILDYFKERIEITNKDLEKNRIPLRVEAVDPIRQVYLYTSTNSEPISLMEDADYTYDINTHEIVFNANSIHTLSYIAEVGDIIEIVYTPNLDDTSICIGYNATRTDTTKECYIDDYYIEYKV